MSGSNAVKERPVVACYRDTDSVGAVQLGEILARALEQPLVIAVAYHYEPEALSARVTPSVENERRFVAAETRAARAHRVVGAGVDVRETVVPAHGIPEAVVHLAGECDACVIVLGRDLEGHVTSSVLAHAPCPVAVSPYSVALSPNDPLTRIGVAYDGSPAACAAVTAARELARVTGADVQLLSVDHGDPAEHLIAASEDLDLLLCGSRGRGRAVAAVLGSVSGRLVQAAHCPVLVIPPRVRRRAGTPLGLTTAEYLTVRIGE